MSLWNFYDPPPDPMIPGPEDRRAIVLVLTVFLVLLLLSLLMTGTWLAPAIQILFQLVLLPVRRPRP